MEMLTGLGAIWGLLVVFWVIASLLIPFFVWGIHSKAHKMSLELSDCKRLLQKIAGEPVVESYEDDGLLRDM